MATNPVVSMPDADRVRRALERCELVVVSDCVRETDTTALRARAAARGGVGREVRHRDELRAAHLAAASVPAASPARAEADWWIVAEVARRMGFGAGVRVSQLLAEIFASTRAVGVRERRRARFRHRRMRAEITRHGVRRARAVPVAAAGDDGATRRARAMSRCRRRDLRDGRFYTPSGKAQLVATPPRPPAHRPSAEYPLVLNTGRIRDQWHTMTRTGRSARLMAHNPEPFALAHPIDAARFGITSGDLVEVRSAVGRIVVRANVGDSVGAGRVFVPMHWSARFASHARVGALIAAAADPESGQPELKHTAVSIRRYEPAWHGFALSREPLAIDGDAYLAAARGQGYWRYELAGERMPGSWPEWADALLGPRTERVELIDSAGRYRGARVAGERLQACGSSRGPRRCPRADGLPGSSQRRR